MNIARLNLLWTNDTDQPPMSILAKVHIAKAQLGLDDESYRALLARVAGVRSAKELNARQAAAVINELQRLGWQPKPRKSQGKPGNFDSLPGEIAVIEALLAEMSLPWSYADSIARRQFGIDRVAWLNQPKQFKAVLAALHVEQEKRTLLSKVEALLKQLAEHDPNWQANLETLPKNWRRHRPTLKELLEALRGAAEARGLS
jgi:phage gp16-like protein